MSQCEDRAVLPATRSQEDLKRAEQLVSEVARIPDKNLHTSYGGLCHRFPVLVMTCGLCQALAFSADKASGSGARAEAHRRLLAHVSAVLGVENAQSQVQDWPLEEYMLHTRRVLSAWVYFKRFAVSILKVQSADASKDDGDAD